MLSMTGFGSASCEQQRGSLQVQISTVNHRNCQVTLRCDVRDVALEDRLRKMAREHLRRGSIQIQVQWETETQTVIPVEQLSACWQQMAALAQNIGAPTPRLEHLAPWIQATDTAVDSEERAALHAVIETTLADALTAVQAMRQQEGTNLSHGFTAMLQQMQELRQQMGVQEVGRIANWQAHLHQRLQVLVGEQTHNGGTAMSEEALIRELAIYTDRIDISEELVRLDSHMQQLTLMCQEDGTGKKIEFLLQECGREVNTIGSKAHDAGLSQLVVEAKSTLEQMREQAANIL